jgi:uncharacterized protein
MSHTPKLFVNLPISDLQRTMAFYGALGFTFNPQFTSDAAACMIVNEHAYCMLLTRPFFEGFIDHPLGDPAKDTAHLIAIDCASRADVDAMVTAAIANGGTQPMPAKDHGFMYQSTFKDPDGHHWEPFWMDPSHVQPAES